MKIAVLVSGGVDSSVALQLLKDQGHDVTAFYLKIWLEDELSYLGDCPWEKDLAYVRELCQKLNVPLEVVSLQKEYHTEVVNYAVSEIKKGRTPNPDMLCNSRIKFGMFLDLLDEKYEKVATGHYAQVVHKDGRYAIGQAPDPIKDQSYFLSHLSQAQLKRALFPIGHLQKEDVRRLAHEFDLPTKDRKDSQGICFLGKLKFRDFVKHYCGENSGDIIEVETGKKIGTHDGFWFYTIGQRQGLGLAGGPWYVAAKDPKENIVYISRNYYSDDKARDTFHVSDFNWFLSAVTEPRQLKVKMRHGPNMHEAELSPEENGRYAVKLKKRDQGIAPGQFAVFYEGSVCVGGGVISVPQKGQ
jgi:tRNA-5-taurinomethyluridine 2-sulfurtransferase